MGTRFDTRLPPNECSEAEEGVHEHCCHHDLPDDHKHAPGQVCCWCGDIYLPDYEPTAAHGEYRPRTTAVLKKRRKASGR